MYIDKVYPNAFLEGYKFLSYSLFTWKNFQDLDGVLACVRRISQLNELFRINR